MPTLHGRGNTNVSKVWFVILAVCVAMMLIVWDVLRSVQDLAEDAAERRNHINELMTELP